MQNLFKKIRSDKREYRKQMARVSALPEEYRFVYAKISNYLWSFCGGSGMDMLKTQYDLIDLFESGAAQGRYVLDVTGEDVAAFCDGLMQGNKLWADSCRKYLNRRISKRLGPDSGH